MMGWVQSIRAVIEEHQAIFGHSDRYYYINAALVLIITAVMIFNVACLVAVLGGKP